MIFISWNVLSCLVLELVIKIKKPLSTNYSSRNKIYIISTVLITIAEFSPMLYFGGFGLTDVDTCFVQDGTISYWFALIPVFVNVPCNLVGFIILKCSEGYNRNKALQKMVRACFSMCITWGYPIFTAGMRTTVHEKYIIMDYFAFIIGSSSGTVLAICRLGSFEIMKRLYKSTCRKKRKPNEYSNKESVAINDVLIEESSLNVMFNELTEDSIKEILIVFSLCLITSSKSKEKFSYSYRKLKYNFEVEDYHELKNYVDISNFQLKKNGIWEYGKNYFDSIRGASGIESEDLFFSFFVMMNLSVVENNNSGGRSGAFIMVTSDQKFILKIINRKERYLLLDILPAYSKRICESKDSKIVRILGMYKVTASKHTFIIMENVVMKKENIMVFDLKGSIDDRYVDISPGNRKSVLKDGNFLEMKKMIVLEKEQKEEIIQALSDDLKFFTKHNIIDYSLLIAFYEDSSANDSRYAIKGADGSSYSLGIIDFLQQYSFEKKMELIYKRMKGKVNTSVCSSRKYSVRFLSFITNSLSSINQQ